MQDIQAPQNEQRDPAPVQTVQDLESRVQPSSSRMLTAYLADVEQNLDEQRWDLALRDAIDLPQIAVALTDPALRSSTERCKAWCTQWVRPANAASDSGAADHERICEMVEKHAGQTSVDSADAVPSVALRRLRLRRYARNAPRGFNGGRTVGENSGAADTFAICTAVVEAIRRWYAHSACHDATAQANLARLAVLR
jgi:hypothetical protein